MTFIEILAFIFGILGIYLTIKEIIWCWLVDIIAVLLQAYICLKVNLLGDFSLQFFYLMTSIYGWIYWKKRTISHFKISNMPRNYFLPVILSVIVLAIIIYPILSYFQSNKLILESFLTAMSLVATYLMTKKWIENWFFWIIADLSYVYLYFQQQLPILAILFIIYSLVAVYGFYTWKKQLKK